MSKYNIQQTELLNFIDNLDLETNQLNDNDKQIRIKYLEMLNKALNEDTDIINAINKEKQDAVNSYNNALKNNPNDYRLNDMKLIVDNYDSVINFIKRINKMMLDETKGPVICPPPTECPNFNNQYIGFSIVIIILLIYTIICVFQKKIENYIISFILLIY